MKLVTSIPRSSSSEKGGMFVGVLVRSNKLLVMTVLMTTFLISLYITPTKSDACSCERPSTVQEEFERSDAVFKGKVIGRIDRNEGDVVQSSADLIVVRFAVKDIWKGINQTEVDVSTERDSSSCGFTFTEGHEYLIYAKEYDGDLRVNICSRTAELPSASTDLELLGKGTVPTESIIKDKEEVKENIDWLVVDFYAIVIFCLAMLVIYFLYRLKKS